MRLGGWIRRPGGQTWRHGGWTKLKTHSLTAQIDSRSSQTIPEAPGSCQKLGKLIFQCFSKFWVYALGVLEAGLGVLESGLGVFEARLGVFEAGLSCQNHSLTAQIGSRSSQTTPEARNIDF